MGSQNRRVRGNILQAAFAQGPLRAFSHPQFRLLWGASLLSTASFFMMMIARGWLILEITDSPFMVTAINALPMLPMALFAPFGGVVADRVDRRLVLIVVEALNIAILLAMALLVLSDRVEVWHVFLLAFFHGVVFSLGMPARMAIVPDLVGPRDLASGAALFTTIFSAAQLAGPAPAGFLAASLGLGQTFLISALMVVPALPLLFVLRLPENGSSGPAGARESVLSSVVAGLAYVRGQPLLVGLLAVGFVMTVFAMPYQALLPVFARDVLHRGAEGLGLLATAGGAGALAGSFLVAAFSSGRQLRLLMVWGGLGIGLLLIAFALSPVFSLSLALALLLGLVTQISMTSNFTLIQLASAPAMRGRVLSIRMFVFGVGPAGMLLLGVGAERLGPAVAVAGMGAVALLLTGLVVLAIPTLRHEQDPEGGEAPLGARSELRASSSSSGGDD